MKKKESEYFPKILIIGESLHKKTGSGVTLFNFFIDWPKENLAILAGSSIWDGDLNMCHNYCIWKTKNRFFPAFLRHFQKSKKRNVFYGPISIEEIAAKQKVKDTSGLTIALSEQQQETTNPWVLILKKSWTYRHITNFYRFFIKHTGLAPFENQIELSADIESWYKSFNPDVIYTFLNYYNQFDLVLRLSKKFNTPIVVHPMDEHIKFMPPKGLLQPYWRYNMNRKFNKLIKTAKVRLSISDYMTEKYEKQYKKKFTAYHNPVDLDKWLPHTKNDWGFKESFRVLYIGRLWFDNLLLLQELAKTIDDLCYEGYNISLDLRCLYSTESSILSTFQANQNTRIISFSSQQEYDDAYDDVPQILPKYDLLYLPIGFDKKSIDYFQLSMPTKTAEYMISGTPILVHAPEQTAVYQYAKAKKWGYLLSTNSPASIKAALIELMTNEKLRKSFGSNARIVAAERHNALTVRNNLRMEFINAINTKTHDENM
jgi:glycosyltransferase involved in cell wall biosynthesis